MPVIVIHDPGEGAFQHGAEFSSEEVIQMLRFKSFNNGTVLQLLRQVKNENFCRHGFSAAGIYVVTGGAVRKQ